MNNRYLENAKNEIGNKYNHLTITQIDYERTNKIDYRGKRRTYCFARCDCDGNEKSYILSDVVKGHTKSCGCVKYKNLENRESLVGKKFGAWTVLRQVDSKITSGGNKKACYECRCICGNIKTVTRQALMNGESKSCGCLKTQYCSQTNYKHGMAYNRIYKIYTSMKSRCSNPNNAEYNRYGGRGIEVCSEWLGDEGFINFYNWATNNGYQDNLSIDRVNNDGNYEPNNCRWATFKEQMNNTSKNHNLTYNNETHTAKEWSKILNISIHNIYYRIKKGYPVEKVLSPDVYNKKQVAVYKNNNLIKIFDTRKEASEYLHIDPSMISKYINKKCINPDGYVFKNYYKGVN